MSIEEASSEGATRRSFAPQPAPAADEPLDEILAIWISAEARPRLIVDAELRVHWANPAAKALLRNDAGVVSWNGRLRAQGSAAQMQLDALVRGAGDGVSSACLSAGSAGGRLVLTATRLQPPWQALVGLTLQRASETAAVTLADLGDAFGLTPTEITVVHHLLGGFPAQMTADAMGTSLETVRTHIKRIYAKLGVSTREAFFNRLSPFVVAVE